jgi:3-dehydroquinate synthase
MMICFLYGPPASGKTTLGKYLAESLELPFLDLDSEIESRLTQTIADIFSENGEAAFRKLELAILQELINENKDAVIALGGGALINPKMRMLAESNGTVICLQASLEKLNQRVSQDKTVRPLLQNDEQALQNLLEKRADHYASFRHQLPTDAQNPEELIQQIQMYLGFFRIHGMGHTYTVQVTSDWIETLILFLKKTAFKGKMLCVTDKHVGNLYSEKLLKTLKDAGFNIAELQLEPGETAKTLESINTIWDACLEGGLDRSSMLIALGGGVVGDMTGFAAATFLRGIPWINIPTTLLSMVDASLGGKTGTNLPQGKNLIGAFHAPEMVLTNPEFLETLPERELRSGMAEVIKHGMIADPELFNLCEGGWKAVKAQWPEVIRRAVAVKAQVIQADPFEQGLRQALNLGHTLGHGVERASHYAISHGEAVAIGMCAAAHISETQNLAAQGLQQKLKETLSRFDLPTSIPSALKLQEIFQGMKVDKKRKNGRIGFVLPIQIGEVWYGIELEGWQQMITVEGNE